MSVSTENYEEFCKTIGGLRKKSYKPLLTGLLKSAGILPERKKDDLIK